MTDVTDPLLDRFPNANQIEDVIDYLLLILPPDGDHIPDYNRLYLLQKWAIETGTEISYVQTFRVKHGEFPKP